MSCENSLAGVHRVGVEQPFCGALKKLWNVPKGKDGGGGGIFALIPKETKNTNFLCLILFQRNSKNKISLFLHKNAD